MATFPPSTSSPTPGAAAPKASPLYQQIKTLILHSLQAGQWKPGEPISSEMELASHYQVSQGTVRKAIDALAAENLLLRRQGKGTFVATHAEQQVQFRFLKLVPDTGDLAQQGPAERQIIDCQRMRAAADVARLLGLKAGDAVLHLRRVLAFKTKPVIYEEAWLPGAAFKGLDTERLRQDRGPMYALFETSFGVRMVRANEKVRAVAADDEAARWLRVLQGTPLLHVERLAYTYSDKPMELRRGWYRTDAHHYQNQLN